MNPAMAVGGLGVQEPPGPEDALRGGRIRCHVKPPADGLPSTPPTTCAHASEGGLQDGLCGKAAQAALGGAVPHDCEVVAADARPPPGAKASTEELHSQLWPPSLCLLRVCHVRERHCGHGQTHSAARDIIESPQRGPCASNALAAECTDTAVERRLEREEGLVRSTASNHLGDGDLAPIGQGASGEEGSSHAMATVTSRAHPAGGGSIGGDSSRRGPPALCAERP